jgi:hypothetical protein
MTTMAALMGTLPIALGLGAGVESRRALGLAVVGGLLFSQLVTLYLTPVVYTYMESARELVARGRRARGARRRARPGIPASSGEEPLEAITGGSNGEGAAETKSTPR